MPDSREFDDLEAGEFSGYGLRIGGLVEAPREFSQGDAEAGADHDAFPHSGLFWRCRMGWRRHARHP